MSVSDSVRALVSDFEGFEPDRFEMLERVAGLAVGAVGGYAGEMVRSAVGALAAGLAGDPPGFVAPGFSGARAMLEMCRGFAVEADEFEDLREVLDAWVWSAGVVEVLAVLDDGGEARRSVWARLADECREFCEWARVAAVDFGGYDELDAVLRGSREWASAVRWAGDVVAGPLEARRMVDVVAYLHVSAHRVLFDLAPGRAAAGDRWDIVEVQS